MEKKSAVFYLCRRCKTIVNTTVLKIEYKIYFSKIFMKKALKIFGIIFGVIIILLIAAPFLFKGSLEKMLKKTINENLNATVNCEKLDLSLLKSFPDASLQLKNFSVINKIPFEGDTLVSGTNLA